jgi:hypothetical protein
MESKFRLLKAIIMKNIHFLLLSLFTLMLTVSCKKYEPALGDPPKLEDATFTYSASATSNNIIEFRATNLNVIAKWDLGNGLSADGSNVRGIYPYAGTYSVKLTIFTKGGSVSSTQQIQIAQTDFTLLDNPLFNSLTGGINGPGFKTWHIDSLVSAHFGVGPDPVGTAGNYPQWWAAGANDKENVGLYDDRYTFYLNEFKFDMMNNSSVYVHNSLAANFPGSYQNLGDYTAPYTNKIGETWTLTEGNDTTLSISNDAFIGFYSGVHTYKILALTDTSLWLQYNHHAGGLMWYLKLIPEGFVSGGNNTPTMSLPINFESTVQGITVFGNSTTAVVNNPDQTGINTSSKVLETVHGNQTWSGFFFDLSDPLDFSTNTSIALKVWAPTTGTFRVKVENSANTNDFVVLDVNVTSANSWQNISVDFTGSASGVYDRLVLFPGWNVANAGTFYIDDIIKQ